MHLIKLFHKERLSLAILFIFTVIAGIWTIHNSIQFFSAATRTWEIKIPLMISLILLFSLSYVVFLFIYDKWSVQTREQLMHLLLIDNRVVYSKFNRYFINVQLVHSYGYKASSINKLSQKDIMYSVQRATSLGKKT